MPFSPRPLWLLLGSLLVAVVLGVLYWTTGATDDDPLHPVTSEPGATERTWGTPLNVERATPTSASGRVTSSNGEPIGDAIVVLQGLETDAADSVVARTDESGQWSAKEVPSGRYVASATAAGHLPAVQTHLLLSPQQSNPAIDFVLEPGGGRLHGTVEDLTGGPIEAAIVRLVPVVGFLDVREREGFSTVTDSDGNYTIHAANGGYRVAVSHLDYAPSTRTIEVGVGSRREDFRLTPMGVVDGIVVRDDDGRPVAGARVSAATERTTMMPGGGRQTVPGPVHAATADERGRFRLRGLSPGTLVVQARAEGLATSAPLSIPVGVAEQVSEVELRLTKAHSIRGRVLQAGRDRRPLVGATVRAVSPGELGGSLSVTGDDGTFTLHGLLAGRYNVTAQAPSHLPQMPGVSVEVRDDVDGIEIELDPGLVVRGRVEPTAMARVSGELRPENVEIGMGMVALTAGSSTSTDENGRFELSPLHPMPITLVARAGDGRIGEVVLDLSRGVPQEVVISLEERARVRGRVIDARGQGLAGATVEVQPVQQGPRQVTLIVNGRDMGSRSAPTSEDGSFTIVGLEGGRYDVSVSDAYGQRLEAVGTSERTGVVTTIDVDPGKSHDGVVLTVDAADGEIAGVVRTGDGHPAADVWVTIAPIPEPWRGPAPPRNARGDAPREERRMVMMFESDSGPGSMRQPRLPPALTDRTGRFRFTGLRDGTYVVTAEQGGGRSRVTQENVRPGSTVTLVLAPLASISGSVRVGNKPVDDAVVTAEGPTRRSVRVRGGRYDIAGIDAGRYTVTARTARASGTAEITVSAGQKGELDIVLAPWSRVRGKVVDEEGKALVGARILIAEGDGGRVMIEDDGTGPDVRTGKDGSFEAHAASGNRVLIVLGTENPRPIAMRPFVAEGGEDVELGTIEERPPGGPGPRHGDAG